jgi:hypothetical protein
MKKLVLYLCFGEDWLEQKRKAREAADKIEELPWWKRIFKK